MSKATHARNWVSPINEDGYFDQLKSISHGYAVHIGFSGHGMSGAIKGPDGKIYWGIGDIGANITAKDGSNYKYPNQGIIVRCNPDGSNFEVFSFEFCIVLLNLAIRSSAILISWLSASIFFKTRSFIRLR